MRTIILSLSLFFVVAAGNAQLPDLKKESANMAVSAGKLLTQFAGALKPDAFADGWKDEKSGWMGKAANASNPTGMASTIAALAGFIKPGMFKQGFNLQSITQAATKVKTMSAAAGLLKNLEGAVKPEAFTSGWGQQRSGWLSALNMLK